MKAIFILSWSPKVIALMAGPSEEEKKASSIIIIVKGRLCYLRKSPLSQVFKKSTGAAREKGKANCLAAKFQFQMDVTHILINPNFSISICL